MKRKKTGQKSDEFYTLFETVERGVVSFLPYLKGKTVYCNCDDYRASQFVAYFKKNFNEIGIKKLISTCYSTKGEAFKYVKTRHSVHTTRLKGDGDFRSEECTKILKEKDVVVITNPPFSIKEEFVCLMMENDIPFLAILPQTIFTMKAISTYVMNEQLWFGDAIENGGTQFMIPESYPVTARVRNVDEHGNKYISFSGIKWVTNIDYDKRHTITFRNSCKYSKKKYKKFDNFPAINISSVDDVPRDYNGVMGIPITCLYYMNPKEYEFVGFRKGLDGKDLNINGEDVFVRYLIKRRQEATA